MDDKILEALELSSAETTVSYLEDALVIDAMKRHQCATELERIDKMIAFLEGRLAVARHKLGPDHPKGEGVSLAT